MLSCPPERECSELPLGYSHASHTQKDNQRHTIVTRWSGHTFTRTLHGHQAHRSMRRSKRFRFLLDGALNFAQPSTFASSVLIYPRPLSYLLHTEYPTRMTPIALRGRASQKRPNRKPKLHTLRVTFPPLQYPYTDDDADLALRSEDGVIFNVQSFYLKAAR